MDTRTPMVQIDDIVFHPLSANEWRVSDARLPKESIDALLGFVARKDRHYYATRLHHPLEAAPLASLAEAAAYFIFEHEGAVVPVG